MQPGGDADGDIGGIRLVLFPAPGSRVTAAASSPAPSKKRRTRGRGGPDQKWRPRPVRIRAGSRMVNRSGKLREDRATPTSALGRFLSAFGRPGCMTRIARSVGDSIGRWPRIPSDLADSTSRSHARTPVRSNARPQTGTAGITSAIRSSSCVVVGR